MGGMAALGVASSRGSGSHSRCKLPHHSKLAGSWLSVSQTHLVAVVFFLVWATGTLPGCCMAFGTAQGGIAPGAVVVPCLHGACLHRHCAKIALLLQKPPKRGFQHQGPQHHSPEVTPGAGGEVLVFFSCRAKTGALEAESDSKTWWVLFQNISQCKPPAPSLHYHAEPALSAVGAHAQLGTEPPGRAGRERRASPALTGSRGR